MRYYTLIKLHEEFKKNNSLFNRESLSFKHIRKQIEQWAHEIAQQEKDGDDNVCLHELIKIKRLLQAAEKETNGDTSLKLMSILKDKVENAIATFNIEINTSAYITAKKLDTLTVDLGMQEPITEDLRFYSQSYFCFPQQDQPQYIASSLFGTTFSARNKTVEKVILSDAGCIAYKRDEQHELEGYSATIADGYGHEYDAFQQGQIAKAATVASKMLVQELNKLTVSDVCLETMKNMLDRIAAKVKDKARIDNMGFTYETTCLAGITTFPALEANKIRVCGLNIGDSMVVAWNPQNEYLAKFTSSPGYLRCARVSNSL